MAFDEGGERTEAPTPRRREEAREQGRIARSNDLTAAAALLAGIVVLKTLGPRLLDGLLASVRAIGDTPSLSPAEMLPWVWRVGYLVVAGLAPVLAVLVVVTAAAALAQTGILLTWTKLTPKLDGLNPVEGARRLFSSEALLRLGVGLAKMIVVSAVAYAALSGQIGLTLAAGRLDPGAVFAVSCELIYRLALRLALVLLILGIVDYLLQRWKLEKSLRMTKEEVKEEMKRMEGDPMVRRRRREVQLRLAMQRLQIDVPRADVVVTNPTEYAVALQYDEREMGAPRLLAKGKDLLALRIRQIAQAHGIPIVQRPPLARALYADVEIGQEIPARLYRAVAEVLAYVYQLSGRKATA